MTEIERLRSLCGELDAEIERLRAEKTEALREATRLLESFVAEHFPPNPDWKPQPDLIGVLLQLSNAVTIARDYKAENAELLAALRTISSIDEYQRDGKDCTADIMRKCALAAITRAEGK